MYARLDIETGSRHFLAEVHRIFFQAVTQLCSIGKEIQHGNRSANNSRHQGIREQIRTGTLAQHFNNFLAAGSEATHGAAKGFTQRTSNDIYSVHYVAMLMRAAA